MAKGKTKKQLEKEKEKSDALDAKTEKARVTSVHAIIEKKTKALAKITDGSKK